MITTKMIISFKINDDAERKCVYAVIDDGTGRHENDYGIPRPGGYEASPAGSGIHKGREDSCGRGEFRRDDSDGKGSEDCLEPCSGEPDHGGGLDTCQGGTR